VLIDATGHIYRRLSQRLDRHAHLVVLVIVTWIVVVLIVLARSKPFWHDEIYTVLVSALALPDIWRASLDGIDLSPPMTAFVTHLVHAAAGEGPVTTRLPGILSFIAGVVVMFAVVRRRTTIGFAIVAALLATMTGAWAQAYEARGQGLAFGLFALALYGWLEAAAGRRVRIHLVVTALALAAGLWTHYYFVLAFLPIVAGEAARQRLQRRFDRGPWLALLASVTLAVPLLFVLRTAAAQRATFWTRPDRLEFGAVHHAVLDRLEVANLRIAAGVLLVLVLIALARRLSSRRWPAGPPADEIVCGVVCLALPALGVLLGSLAGVFHERYVLFTGAGLVMTIPIVVWWLTTPSVLAEVVAAVVVLHAFANLTEHAFRDPAPARSRLADSHVIADAMRRPGPLVVNGGVRFLELWHSAPPALRAKVM
jgi:Dolichyl-phosphate-mannose-protein mannosyltransferase